MGIDPEGVEYTDVNFGSNKNFGVQLFFETFPNFIIFTITDFDSRLLSIFFYNCNFFYSV